MQAASPARAAVCFGVGGAPEFDQRGSGFDRVLDGDGDSLRIIDIGAYETVFVSQVTGDFDMDGDLDLNDIDVLVAEIAAGTNHPDFDLTGDDLVTLADRDAWLALAGEVNLGPGKVYLLGDATLDGVVDGLDFIQWNSNKFTSVAAWSAGDFNADGIVDGLDFIQWNNNKFTSSDAQLRWGPVLRGDHAMHGLEQAKDDQSIVDALFAQEW